MSTTRWRRVGRLSGAAAIVAAAALGLSACGGGSPPDAAHRPGSAPVAAGHGTVVISNFAFHPSNFTVAPGARITVTNKDSVTHTFTADDGAFDTHDLAPGRTAAVRAPTKAGTYPFRCTIHQFMTGTLTVR